MEKSISCLHSSPMKILWSLYAISPNIIFFHNKIRGSKNSNSFFFFLENIYWPTVYLGEGNGNPLQYSCLENPMDRGARWATVHGVAKSWTRLSNFTYLLTYCVSVSGSLGIVELNKIHALRKLEICEWATQANSMIFWNSHSHSCLNYNSGESKLFQITQIVASLLHFTVPVDSTILKHPLGPHVNIPLKNN